MAKRFQQPGGGLSQRQLRVAENLRRALSDVLLRGEAHDPELSKYSITVSEVRASPDLKHAIAFVLPLGGVDEAGALAALKRAAPELRHLVSKKVMLKYAPELKFKLDESFDRMDDTRRLLNREAVRRDTESS